MVDKNNDDNDKRMNMEELFVEVGELVFRSSNLIEEVAPIAGKLTPEDGLILLSMGLALEAHLKAIRDRYGVGVLNYDE